MTKLFLYGLGCGCLSIIGLLIWDAYLAKRRMRQWSDKNWNPFLPNDGSSTGLSANVERNGISFLLNRLNNLKSAILMTTAVVVLVVFAMKRHAADAHQPHIPSVPNDGQIQNDYAKNTGAHLNDYPAFEAVDHPWNFMSEFAMKPAQSTDASAETIGDTSEWLNLCEWISAGGTAADFDNDFFSDATLGLSDDSSANESACDPASVFSENCRIDYILSNNALQMQKEKLLLQSSLNSSSVADSSLQETGLLVQ